MPGFNGSGTFERTHSWTADRNNSIKIVADRHDAEDDAFATGLSSVICKDGQTTTTARIPFAAGVGLSDGSNSSPGLAFTSDPNSGLYRVGADNIAITLNGAKTFDFKTTGLGLPDGDVSNLAVYFSSDANTGFYLSGADALTLVAGGVASVTIDNDQLILNTGVQLTLQSGGVLNFDNGDVTVTHSANALTVAGGTFGVTGAATVSTSVTTPIVYGGTANNSSLLLNATSSGSPSGSQVVINAQLGTSLTVGSTVAITDSYTDTTSHTAFNSTLTLTPSGAVSATMVAGQASAVYNSTSVPHTGTIVGLTGTGLNSGTQNVTAMQGVNASVTNNSTGGITGATAGRYQILHTGTSTVGTSIGVNVLQPTGSSSNTPTFTTIQGLLINNQLPTGTNTVVTNATRAIELSNQTGAGAYAIRMGTGKFEHTPSPTVASAAGATLDHWSMIAGTTTISGSTNITTTNGFSPFTLYSQTYTASAAAVAITNAATLTIVNAPQTSGSGGFTPTITNAYAIRVMAGNSRFGGGVWSSNDTAGIGYITGAGGSQTQGTSKSTTVTLDKVCGQITMHNATLNAGTSVGFTLSNSTIAANDVVNVAIKSGATADSYNVTVDATAAGSCRIQLRNVSAGNLSEAVVLNFAVIKGVAS
jgi:hypothetical protein